MASLWKDASGNLLVDENGNPFWCDECPCDVCCFTVDFAWRHILHCNFEFVPFITPDCDGPYTYAWDFNGQGTSTAEQPTFDFGTAPLTGLVVTLTVTGTSGCEVTVEHTLNCDCTTSPQADFLLESIGCDECGYIWRVTDTSNPNGTTIESWLWKVQSAATSPEMIFFFVGPGPHEFQFASDGVSPCDANSFALAQLWVTNDEGCTSHRNKQLDKNPFACGFWELCGNPRQQEITINVSGFSGTDPESGVNYSDANGLMTLDKDSAAIACGWQDTREFATYDDGGTIWSYTITALASLQVITATDVPRVFIQLTLNRHKGATASGVLREAFESDYSNTCCLYTSVGSHVAAYDSTGEDTLPGATHDHSSQTINVPAP